MPHPRPIKSSRKQDMGALAKPKEIFFYKGFIKVPFYMRNNHRFGAIVNLMVSVLRHGEEKPWSNGYIYVEHEELSPQWLLQLFSGPSEPFCSVLGNMAFPKWSSALHPLYPSHNPSAHTHGMHLSTQTAFSTHASGACLSEPSKSILRKKHLHPCFCQKLSWRHHKCRWNH